MLVTWGFSQTLNQNAAWPNVNWTLTGTYNPTGVLNDPTVDANFTFDDESAGNDSNDSISAISPIIDLTPAFTNGEINITVTGTSIYNTFDATDILVLQWYNADLATWTNFHNYVPVPDPLTLKPFTTCTNMTAYTSNTIDIGAFTPTQLTGFKYRVLFDDNDSWQQGFCVSAPTITSSSNCPKPTALTVANETIDGADLGWTAGGTESVWDIVVVLKDSANTGVPTFANITNNPYTATGLNDDTDYDFYVRAYCGTSSSGWAGPMTFTTLIITTPIAVGDSLETDEDVSKSIDVLANDTTPSSNADSTSIDLDPLTAGIQDTVISTGGTWTVDTLGIVTFVPEADFCGLDSINYTFMNDSLETSNEAKILVNVICVNDAPFVDNEYISTPIDTQATGDLTDAGDGDVDGNLVVNTTPLYGPNDGTITILADGTFTYDPNTSFIGNDTVIVEICDDGTPALCVNDTIFINVFDPSVCQEPSNLSASNVSGASADLDWIENGTAAIWDLQILVSGGTPSGIPTDPGVTMKPFTATGLTGSTAYDFYVRSDCAGDNSGWVGPFTFTTTVGIEENKSNLNLSIYPNPSKGMFSVNVSNNALTEVSITLVSIDGKVISSIKLQADNNKASHLMDLSDENNGIYFVKISSNLGETTQKVVIQ